MLIARDFSNGRLHTIVGLRRAVVNLERDTCRVPTRQQTVMGSVNELDVADFELNRCRRNRCSRISSWSAVEIDDVVIIL